MDNQEHQVFVIYKQKDKWIMECKQAGKLEHAECSARARAISTIFKRHPGATLFYVVLPITSNTEAKDGK